MLDTADCSPNDHCRKSEFCMFEVSVGIDRYIVWFHLVGGFKNVLFSISYMGCHPSHWRTHIFQRGRPTTNQLLNRISHDQPLLTTINHYLGMGQNLVPLVNIKIAGKSMFIPLKMVLIGIDPYPSPQILGQNMLQDLPPSFASPRQDPAQASWFVMETRGCLRENQQFAMENGWKWPIEIDGLPV